MRRIAALLVVMEVLFVYPVIFPKANMMSPKGPYISSLKFQSFMSHEDQIRGLQNNEIDLISGSFRADDIQLLQSEKIRVDSVPINAYCVLFINCEKYPFNVTGFRRAIAFALDKELIAKEVWRNQALPLDSPVSRANYWSYEEKLEHHYYRSEIATANNLLDRTGMIDIDGDGWRETPEGEDLNVKIEMDSTSSSRIWDTAIMAQNAMRTIGINATAIMIDWCTGGLWPRLYNHGDYDIALINYGTSNLFDVRWLAYEFWSANAERQYYNFPNFRNRTFDSWRSQLLNATSFDEVFAASIAMQKILVYECPLIPIVEYLRSTAYRVDRFEGFVVFPRWGVANWWTNYLVHLKPELGGPFGSTLRWGVPEDFEFNLFRGTGPEAWMLNDNFEITTEFYDSLLRISEEGGLIPWLAQSVSIQTHADDSQIPEQRTRIVFEIVDNATWSNGSLITAEDVVATFNFYREVKSNPFFESTMELTAIYSPRPNVVILEFYSESYWHLYTVGCLPILPRNLLNQIRAIGWENWKPDPLDDSFVTSGPFVVANYSYETLIMVPNENYFYRAHISSQTTTSTTVSANGEHPFLAILTIIGVVAFAVTVVLVTFRRRRM